MESLPSPKRTPIATGTPTRTFDEIARDAGVDRNVFAQFVALATLTYDPRDTGTKDKIDNAMLEYAGKLPPIKLAQ